MTAELHTMKANDLLVLRTAIYLNRSIEVDLFLVWTDKTEFEHLGKIQIEYRQESFRNGQSFVNFNFLQIVGIYWQALRRENSSRMCSS